MKVILSTFCLLFVAVISFANHQIDDLANIDPHLFEILKSQNKVDCLIQFKEKTDLSRAVYLKTKAEKGVYVFDALQKTRDQSQEETLDYLIDQNATFTSFYICNAIAVKLSMDQILHIANFKNTKSIVHDPSVRQEKVKVSNNNITKELPVPEWGITMIQADSVWRLGYDGTGVIIGGQDTGYEWEHPALIKKYKGTHENGADHNYNWHDAIREINPENSDSINPCGLDSPFPCDDHNHGTHTMGTMVGSDTLNSIGVAPSAKWIACRNMERGIGKPSTYLECLEWFLAPTDLNSEFPNPELAPDVINNSWSCPEEEGCNETNWSLMEDAIINLKTAGVVVIVSAGNEGRDGCGTIARPPAIFESSYAIGATRANDTIANFSSRGPVIIDSSFRLKPDVSAPGHNVRSSIRNGEYQSFSGTSMAGPHVVGAVALIINANPQLRGQVSTIENILTQTAEIKFDSTECFNVLGLESPNHVYGAGRINVLKAVELAQTMSNVTPLKIDDFSFNLFPNPANEILNIEFDTNIYTDYSISIFDLKGSLLKNEIKSPKTINLFGLTEGIYLVKFENKHVTSYKRLIVTK